MREPFEINGSVELITAKQFEQEGDLPSHYSVLKGLANNALIPNDYINMLDLLEPTDKNSFSKKLLKIYLFAASRYDGKKLFDWLQKGSLPTESSYGESMSFLTKNAKKITSIEKSRNKAIDQVTNARTKLEKKNTKRLSDSLEKGTEKVNALNEQYDTQRKLIDQVLSEIETLLASGRKL